MEIQQQNLNEFTKVYSALPHSNSFEELKLYLKNNQKQIIDEVHQYGIILFRGFETTNSEQFQILIQECLELQTWNSFNPNMPAWVATCMRKYSENILGAGDYRRYLDRNTVQLGPVENSIQGPHVEGGVRSVRARYIALSCLEPSTHLAETGFNSLAKLWLKLPAHLKQKYKSAWNNFSYISARKLNFIDRILLKNSPFRISILNSGHAKLSLAPCPFVIQHPNTNEHVLQPWAFARNTNDLAYHAALNSFKNRGEIKPDSTADGMQLTWEIYDHKNNKIEWNQEDQLNFFKALYEDSFLLQWQKGDIAIVDNIKIAHWRMNGIQGNRKLIQIQANAFNACDFYLKS